MKVAIVGGGIVGLATAYQLLLRFPSTQLLLLEKEAGPARHQTGNNSGVLHCGLYYKPGSQKAKLAVEGIRRMVEFCERHAVPHEICGKLVVATEPEEIPRLHALLERGYGQWTSRPATPRLPSRCGSTSLMLPGLPRSACRKRESSTSRLRPRPWPAKFSPVAARSSTPQRFSSFKIRRLMAYLHNQWRLRSRFSD